MPNAHLYYGLAINPIVLYIYMNVLNVNNIKWIPLTAIWNSNYIKFHHCFKLAKNWHILLLFFLRSPSNFSENLVELWQKVLTRRTYVWVISVTAQPDFLKSSSSIPRHVFKFISNSRYVWEVRRNNKNLKRFWKIFLTNFFMQV